MLGAMDISAAAAGPWIVLPWIVLGAVLGIALTGLAALGVARLSRRPPAAAPPAAPVTGFPDDDLAAFLEAPPGSGPRPAAVGGNWPPLAAPPVAEVPDAPVRGPGRTLIALAAVALLLLGAAAVVAVSRQPVTAAAEPGTATPPSAAGPSVEPPAAPTPDEQVAGGLAGTDVRVGARGVAADLRFGGLILERRAVGVTVTYPEVRLTASGRSGAVAHVRLPTWNCLAAAAPADPVAAGCTPTVAEYADLASPALTVHRDGARWRIHGRFPTYQRPNGTPPLWTGRVYELVIDVGPADGKPARGRVPADGTVRLGDDEARTTGGPGVTVLRYGD
jgi:hypothetical protein